MEVALDISAGFPDLLAIGRRTIASQSETMATEKERTLGQAVAAPRRQVTVQTLHCLDSGPHLAATL